MYEFDPELAAEISAIPLEAETLDLVEQEARNAGNFATAVYTAIGAAESVRYRGVRLEFEHLDELKIRYSTVLKPLDFVELQLGYLDTDGNCHGSRKLDLLVDDVSDATFLVAHDSAPNAARNITNRVVQLASYTSEFSDQFRQPPIQKHVIKPFEKLVIDTESNDFHGHEDDRLWLPDHIVGLWIGKLALMNPARVE